MKLHIMKIGKRLSHCRKQNQRLSHCRKQNQRLSHCRKQNQIHRKYIERGNIDTSNTQIHDVTHKYMTANTHIHDR